MDRREPSTRGYSTCECERQTWNQIPPLQGVVSEEVNFERASLNVAPKYTWHSTNVRLDFLENGASRGKISPHVSCTFSHVEQPTVDRSFPSRSELAGIQVRPINFQTRSSRKRSAFQKKFTARKITCCYNVKYIFNLITFTFPSRSELANFNIIEY